MSKLSYEHIGLQGNTVGSVTFKENIIEWTDRAGANVKKFSSNEIVDSKWTLFGPKNAHIKLYMKNGEIVRLDGFPATDFENISNYFSNLYGKPLIIEEVINLY